jgi:hypothetical protein
LPRSSRGVGASPETRLEIVLDAERSAWVLQEAQRAGVDFESYVNALIDAARQADADSTQQEAATPVPVGPSR